MVGQSGTRFGRSVLSFAKSLPRRVHSCCSGELQVRGALSIEGRSEIYSESETVIALKAIQHIVRGRKSDIVRTPPGAKRSHRGDTRLEQPAIRAECKQDPARRRYLLSVHISALVPTLGLTMCPSGCRTMKRGGGEGCVMGAGLLRLWWAKDAKGVKVFVVVGGSKFSGAEQNIYPCGAGCQELFDSTGNGRHAGKPFRWRKERAGATGPQIT